MREIYYTPTPPGVRDRIAPPAHHGRRTARNMASLTLNSKPKMAKELKPAKDVKVLTASRDLAVSA